MGVSEVSHSSHGAAAHGSTHVGGTEYRCYYPPGLMDNHDSFDKKHDSKKPGNVLTHTWDHFTGWVKSLWYGAIGLPKSIWQNGIGHHFNHHHKPHLDPEVAKALFCVPVFKQEWNPFFPDDAHGHHAHAHHSPCHGHGSHNHHGTSTHSSQSSHATPVASHDSHAPAAPTPAKPEDHPKEAPKDPHPKADDKHPEKGMKDSTGPLPPSDRAMC